MKLLTIQNQRKTKKKDDSDLPLDKYLAKNTSEDNASFATIMHENELKHRQKHAWLYEQEEEKKKDKEEVLALPSIEKQAIMPNSAELQTWNYQAKNSLMYVPDGAAASAKEKIEEKGLKPKEVVHQNTRFKVNPFNMEKSKETIQQAASEQALAKHGKIGHDGKEILPEQSPQVNGYGFVATPSPAPGVDESPFMTWGEIEGTPFRLDGGETPVTRTPGPTFRIPEVPKRDRIGLNLAEEVGKAHRAKKKEALKRVTARLSSPSPKFGMSKTERLNSMSPAAQRLASSKLRIRTNTDKALRASYTPSPSHRLIGDKTPIQTTPSPRQTPKSGAGTPKTLVTPKRISSEGTLTDNLLNLPIKRKKAEDFF
jgi:protein DGCR14